MRIPYFLFKAFRSGETRLHELNYLFWECTTRCNLHCRHCGSDCFAASKDVDMPKEDFMKVLDSIPASARPKEFSVVLTGGEPLLRPDIEQVGLGIRSRGFLWGMVSNGYFYDEAMHAKLIRAGMSALTISLDGLDESHDWMRGRQGSFERALKAISIAAKEPRLNFDVVTCVTKRNLGQLERIHDLLSSLGVAQWRLFTVIPIGRAKDDPDMHLDAAQTKALMDFIVGKREAAKAGAKCPGEKAMNVTFSCEGYLGSYEQKAREAPYFCRAGINIASVLIDGTISACPNIDREVFGQGNIYKDDFWQVWNEKFRPYRDRSWARKGMCADCKVFDRCLGNGMHNWHGDCSQVLNCHYSKLKK
ncbi:MAG: TIGR04133 family radical SAM/SPASM protein [Bacteroidales bacterium]|nr:TIGR04133 family radical SAM/SPASM protein [Bacteroidales bacterium]